MSGSLVLLEGLDGSGKTTQMELLEKALRRNAVPLRRVKFPNYGEPYSAPVRMYLNGEFGKNPDDVNAYAASTFFAVDRYASFRKVWGNDYRRGILILADRYTTSNVIYQMPKLPRNQWDGFVGWLEDFEYGKLGLPKPDLTVYLDMPSEISEQLIEKRCLRGKVRDIHERDAEYLAACREGASYAIRRFGWKTISCAENGIPKSADRVHGEILKILEPFLGDGGK